MGRGEVKRSLYDPPRGTIMEPSPDGGPQPRHVGGPPLLRQINSTHVLAVLRESGPLSLSVLAARTGLSRPTIGQVVGQLHAAGLVADAEPGQAGVGRPARLVRFRAEAAYVLGIDIGRHKVGVMVADLAGQMVARHRRDNSGASSSKDILAALRRAAREALAEAGIEREDVASVAAGTPGLVELARLLATAPERLDAEAVFAAAAHGDPVAVEVVQTIAARFARGLAPVLLVLDPDLVVIGAGLSRAGDALLAAIEACVRPLTLV